MKQGREATSPFLSLNILQATQQFQASLMAQKVKNPSAMWEIWVQSLGWEDSPGEGNGYPLQYSWDFPDSLVVKTLHFQSTRCWFDPWSGTKIPHAKAKKKKNWASQVALVVKKKDLSANAET